MNETNKSLRIRTNVGKDKYVTVNLDSEYDILEILSLKIKQIGAYRYHTSDYGVVVGRVLANNGFGIPNAKLSLFIKKEENQSIIENTIYPYSSVSTRDNDGIRYNLLPRNKKDDCHQVVGTFPNKRLILDDNSVLEVFDKYYKFTTTSNESGDYMFFGIPTGQYTLHMDLDISDCGKLSQRPRDFVYKGYNLDLFENPNQFKIDTELSSLAQIFTQDISIDVKPFWGNSNEVKSVGITREDIDVKFVFEPTCVFMGSIISDVPTEGIGKNCKPSARMGEMRSLTTGSGTIEIIRKRVDNTIEELQIKGKQLINGDGVWCFQIPMNLDYVVTDEYGNMVPSDNPEKGIPTRCEVRFRMSLEDTESEGEMYKRGKVLVPHNPKSDNGNDLDYNFGSFTKDSSFRSLMWNGVYTVKSFIPRIQKAKRVGVEKFTGIKSVNLNGSNNPMPYNNIRIKLPFLFRVICNIAKLFVFLVQVFNELKRALMGIGLGLINLPYTYIGNEFSPDLEYWYFAPGMGVDKPKDNFVKKFWRWLTGQGTNECGQWQHESVCLTFKSIISDIGGEVGEAGEDFYTYIGNELTDADAKLPTVLTKSEFNGVKWEGDGPLEKFDGNNFKGDGGYYNKGNWLKTSQSAVMKKSRDEKSTEVRNALSSINPKIKLSPDTDYLMQSLEMALAQEYEVLKFDFYNDWINGAIYLPRWSRDVKYRKKRKNGKKEIITKVKGCINGHKGTKSRRLFEMCSLQYNETEFTVANEYGCNKDGKLRCHRNDGRAYTSVFGKNKGAVQEQETMLGQYVYYMVPKEGEKVLFATDIVMLGSLFDCNEYGLPSTFESLLPTTYKLPSNLASTNADADSESYFEGDVDNAYLEGQGPPSISEIKKWICGKNACAINNIAEGGVVAQTPSYQQIIEMLNEYEGINDDDSKKVLEYEDIFPLTEMSGIEWGYNGPGQLASTDDKIFSPGGHFMGLSCNDAETNIKTCVNLKRACEIGTTFSERLEIPIGFNDKDKDDDFDEVNYLFVSPNGLISKDQVVDVTFRSAFATMNQNSLRTETDPTTLHKKYVFEYLLPDSFDGSLRNYITGDKNKNNKYGYNNRIELEWDSYWDENEMPEDIRKDVIVEQGYTVHRAFEDRNDDYIKFRYGNSVKFLHGSSSRMPQTMNSFYFYFGIKQGATALDEFKKQFFAPCEKYSLITDNNINVDIMVELGEKPLHYDVKIVTNGMTQPLLFILNNLNDNNYDKQEANVTANEFTFNDVKIGEYEVHVSDDAGNEYRRTVQIGINNFSIDYDKNSIIHYKKTDKRTEISEFGKNKTDNGGYLYGSFNLIKEEERNGVSYSVKICNYTNEMEVTVGERGYNNLYDKEKNHFWFFGQGEYRIKLIAHYNSKDEEYLYDVINVESGINVPPIYFLDLANPNFNNIDEISDLVDRHLYKQYKALVSRETFGEPYSMPITLGKNIGDFDLIIAGRGERVTSNDDGEKEYELGTKVDVHSNLEDNFALDMNNLYIPTDYDSNNKRYFYYTSCKKRGDSSVFSTDNELVKVNNGKISLPVNWKNDSCEYVCLLYNNEYHIKPYASTIDINDATDVIVAQMSRFPFFISPMSFELITVISSSNNNKDNVSLPFKTLVLKTTSPEIYECVKNATTINVIDKADSVKEMQLTDVRYKNIKYKITDDKLSITFVIIDVNTAACATLINGNDFQGISLNVCNLEDINANDLEDLNNGKKCKFDEETASTSFTLEKDIKDIRLNTPIWCLLYEKTENDGKAESGAKDWEINKCTLHAIKTVGFGYEFNENLELEELNILETVNITFKDKLHRFDEETKKYVETDTKINIEDIKDKGLKSFTIEPSEFNIYRDGKILSAEYAVNKDYKIYKSNLENSNFDVTIKFVFDDEMTLDDYDAYIKHEGTNYPIEKNSISIQTSYKNIETIDFEIFYVKSNEN